MHPRPTWVRPPNSEDARCPGTCGGDDPGVVRGIQSTPWSAASQPDAQLALVFPLELLHRGGRAHDQKQRTAVALGPGSRGSSTWGIYIINSISTQCFSKTTRLYKFIPKKCVVKVLNVNPYDLLPTAKIAVRTS